MSFKKEYGKYQTDNCPFCGGIATQKNAQGIAVCRSHLQSQMEDRRCVCGKWLELCSGKYGPYFFCLNCGNVSLSKGLKRGTAIKAEPLKEKPGLKSSLYEGKEIEITSRDAEYFD